MNIKHLERDLTSHPNQPFIQSIIRGLREGFWPWADPSPPNYPLTLDESIPTPANPEHKNFISLQCKTEQQAGRYSEFFGTKLLDGMYCMPQHVVAREDGKLRLVSNQSAGPYSLNSMVPPSKRSFPLDGIQNFCRSLRAQHSRSRTQARVLCKSDIKGAYRILPMAFAWQAKQAVKINGQYCIDRCNTFGGAASGRLFVAFNSVLLWLANHVHGIKGINAYVDDNFWSQSQSDLVLYEPYNKYYPSQQAALLRMWDYYGVPHSEPKQLYGPVLPIIGFTLDLPNMRVSIDATRISDLIHTIHEFCSFGQSKSSKRRTLREFQRLAGWINWALNVFPLLRPGLASLYAKIINKARPHAKLYVSEAIVRDLQWISNHMRQSSGVFMLKAIAWAPSEANLVLFTDASSIGIGFWCPTRDLGFYSALPHNPPTNTIFYFEDTAFSMHFKFNRPF